MIDKKIGLEKHRVYIESSYELTEDERVIAQVLLNTGYISLYRADGVYYV